jgi:hypothetical protein
MSRAFVKETESDTTGLPDRPVSTDRNFVTVAGLADIEAALGRFEAAHRAALESGDRNAASRALGSWVKTRPTPLAARSPTCRLSPARS